MPKPGTLQRTQKIEVSVTEVPISESAPEIKALAARVVEQMEGRKKLNVQLEQRYLEALQKAMQLRGFKATVVDGVMGTPTDLKAARVVCVEKKRVRT